MVSILNDFKAMNDMRDTGKTLQEILKALSEERKETTRPDPTRTRKTDDKPDKEEPGLSQAALFFLGR